MVSVTNFKSNSMEHEIFFIIAKFREKRLKIELHINLLQFLVFCFFIVRLSAEVGSSVLHFT